jgi:hypothetical protein
MAIDDRRAAPGSGRSNARPALRIQTFGIDPTSLQELGGRLQAMAALLPADLVLQEAPGDVVLIEAALIDALPVSIVRGYFEGRPCIALPRERPTGDSVYGAIAAQQLRRLLLDQIDAMLRRRHGPPEAPDIWPAAQPLASPFDTCADSRWSDTDLLADPADERQRLWFIVDLHRARRRGTAARMHATYGPAAGIVFDFGLGIALIDAAALQPLRLRQQLPLPSDPQAPGTGATRRDLDSTLWDIGIAAAALPLLDSPANGWDHPLRARDAGAIARHAGSPLHHELARLLASGPCAPSRLRRACRTTVHELRGFVQACLLLDLVEWERGGPTELQVEPRASA